jgi:hypothetical protein
MAGLAEAVSERLIYKLYADAAIDATTELVTSVAPGASGGQSLRHVSHNLSLSKDSYRPNEKRDDVQQPMGKHGSRSVAGTINGFLSPGTHQDLFAAVMRSDWTTPVELDETDLTSVAFDATAKTATFGGGDPVALGMRVGRIYRFANLATADNNDKNFIVLGFSGGSNRVVSIFPAPTTETADTGFTVTEAGASAINPPTKADRTEYKVAFEANNPDIDLSKLFTEAKITGFDLSIGVNANVGLNFSVLGRNRKVLSGSSAPFFTSPAAQTTTDIPTAMQGLLMSGGSVLGVATSLSIKVDLGAEAAKAMNSEGLIAGIMLGDFVCSGDFTVFLQDDTFLSAFDNETELALLAYLPSTNAADAPANAFYLPRIKINSNSESDTNKAKAIQCSFEAGRYVGTAPGVESTTLQITDTQIA